MSVVSFMLEPLVSVICISANTCREEEGDIPVSNYTASYGDERSVPVILRHALFISVSSVLE